MANPLPIFNAKIAYHKNDGNHVANDSIIKKTPGSLNTIDEDYNKRQYGPRDFTKKIKSNHSSNETEPAIYKLLADPKIGHQLLPKKKLVKSDAVQEISNLASKARAVIVSGQIIWLCVPFFLGQIFFWFVSILGLIAEFGGYSIGNFFGDNIVGKNVGDLISSIVPGESIFLLGYLGATLCAIIQLLIANFLYISKKINPLKAGAGLVFIFILALYCLIFIGGIAPWGLIWMKEVISNVNK